MTSNTGPSERKALKCAETLSLDPPTGAVPLGSPSMGWGAAPALGPDPPARLWAKRWEPEGEGCEGVGCAARPQGQFT